MKTRTCPHCNYQYSLSEYFRKPFFKFSLAEWNCKNCGNRITFSIKRRLLMAVAILVYFFAVAMLTENLAMNTFMWVIAVLVLLSGLAFIYSLDTFKKVE
ncbi:MAG: hypothetical protein ACXWEY_14415 [Bacteroidia bacterium]